MNMYKISPSMLLYEDVRDKLFENDLLRPMMKEDDIIWQQMKWEFFPSLIDNGLFFKQHSEFTEYDERKIQDYNEQHMKKYRNNSKISKEKLSKLLTEADNRIFISCWYNSKDLSDVVFKQYTGVGSGIAIGTTVKDLLEYLKSCEPSYDENNDQFFAGNIQYMNYNDMVNGMLFEETQIIAPIFLKGIQFKMDNEFRICFKDNTSKIDVLKPIANSEKNNHLKNKQIQNNKKYLKNYTGSELSTLSKQKDKKGEIEKNMFKEIEKKDQEIQEKISDYFTNVNHRFFKGDIKKLIKYIAIKNEGVCSEKDENIIENDWLIDLINNKLSESGLQICDKGEKNNGFIRFNVKEMSSCATEC